MRWIVSSQSISLRLSPRSVRRWMEASLPRVLPQRLLELPSSAMQPTHHCPDGDVHDLGYLYVGEALDVGEEDGHAELLRQRLERLLHQRIRHRIEDFGLGRAVGPGGFEPAQPPVEVEVF